MEPIIVADVHISRTDFLAINWPVILRKRGWLYGLLMLWFIYLLWSSGLYESGSIIYQVAVTVGTIAAFVLLIAFSLRRAFRKQYDSTPLLQQTATYTLSSTGIEKNGPLQHLELPWSSIQGVRKLGKWYFLTTGPQRGEFLDPARIQAPATEASLCALLAQHGLSFKQG